MNDPNAVYQFDYDCNTRELKVEACLERNENTFIADWYRSVLKERRITKSEQMSLPQSGLHNLQASFEVSSKLSWTLT